MQVESLAAARPLVLACSFIGLSLLLTSIVCAAESWPAEALPAKSPATNLESDVRLRFDHSPKLMLSGRDARLQLVITAVAGDSETRDVSHSVELSAEPAGLVEIDGALLIPKQDGTVTITARGMTRARRRRPSSALATWATKRKSVSPARSFPSLPNLVATAVDAMARRPAKTGSNYRCSVLVRARITNTSSESHAVDGSPLPTQTAACCCSKRSTPRHMVADSALPRTATSTECFVAGSLKGCPTATAINRRSFRIEVLPQHRRMQPGAAQQLSAIARYSDGTVEDVTRAAVFESNDPEMASVSDTGLVDLGNVVGDVAVMTRYQGHVSVFRADIPLMRDAGEPLPVFPEPTENLVDALVWEKLRSLGVPPSPRLRRSDVPYAASPSTSPGVLPTIEEAGPIPCRCLAREARERGRSVARERRLRRPLRRQMEFDSSQSARRRPIPVHDRSLSSMDSR